MTAGDTGQPLRKAMVRLNQIDGQTGVTTNPGRESRTMSTDADGKYEFKDLPAGRYTVSVSKGAYVNADWGSSRTQAPAGRQSRSTSTPARRWSASTSRCRAAA